jgi:monothiol glutaredoxin
VDEATRQKIEATLTSHPVVLYMKGSRRMPMCGFSSRVVQILDGLLDDYLTVNVLQDAALREGIKEYAAWPTIPQLYVRGELVGGCDIVSELHDSGELAQKLGVAGADRAEPRTAAPPKIHVTAAAAEAFRAALETDRDIVRLEVGPRFEYDLTIGERQPGDCEVDAGGLVLLVDADSAARADGTTIDYVDTPQGPAFKIQNPNEPPRVKSLSARELKQKLDAGSPLTLVDVRTPEECQIAAILGARLLDREVMEELLALDRETTLVFHCHHGVRSQGAAEHFVAQGFRNVYNLTGGIEAWSLEVDPNVARY